MKTTKSQRDAMRELGIVPPGWRVHLLDDADEAEAEVKRLRAMARGLITLWRDQAAVYAVDRSAGGMTRAEFNESYARDFVLTECAAALEAAIELKSTP